MKSFELQGWRHSWLAERGSAQKKHPKNIQKQATLHCAVRTWLVVAIYKVAKAGTCSALGKRWNQHVCLNSLAASKTMFQSLKQRICALSNFKSNVLRKGTVLKKWWYGEGCGKLGTAVRYGGYGGEVRWVRWYGTLGWVVRYGGHGTTFKIVCYSKQIAYYSEQLAIASNLFATASNFGGTVRWALWVRYGGYHEHGTVGTVGTHRTVPLPRDRTSVPRLRTHCAVPIKTVIRTYPCWTFRKQVFHCSWN